MQLLGELVLHKRVMIAAVGVLAVAAATPGLASNQGGPVRQIEDPCGDADSTVTVGSTTQQLEAGDPARDLAGAGFRISYNDSRAAESLVAEVESCGAASSATELLVQIGFAADNCVLNVQYIPRRLDEGVTQPQVRVTEDCFGEPTVPGLGVGSGVREVSRITLPASAATFSGNTTRIVVPLASIPAVTAPRLAVGTVWDGSAAVLGDPEVGNFAAAGGTFPNPDAAVTARFDIGRGIGYVVGQDQPKAE